MLLIRFHRDRRLHGSRSEERLVHQHKDKKCILAHLRSQDLFAGLYIPLFRVQGIETIVSCIVLEEHSSSILSTRYTT